MAVFAWACVCLACVCYQTWPSFIFNLIWLFVVSRQGCLNSPSLFITSRKLIMIFSGVVSRSSNLIEASRYQGKTVQCYASQLAQRRKLFVFVRDYSLVWCIVKIFISWSLSPTNIHCFINDLPSVTRSEVDMFALAWTYIWFYSNSSDTEAACTADSKTSVTFRVL